MNVEEKYELLLKKKSKPMQERVSEVINLVSDEGLVDDFVWKKMLQGVSEKGSLGYSKSLSEDDCRELYEHSLEMGKSNDGRYYFYKMRKVEGYLYVEESSFQDSKFIVSIIFLSPKSKNIRLGGNIVFFKNTFQNKNSISNKVQRVLRSRNSPEEKMIEILDKAACFNCIRDDVFENLALMYSNHRGCLLQKDLEWFEKNNPSDEGFTERLKDRLSGMNGSFVDGCYSYDFYTIYGCIYIDKNWKSSSAIEIRAKVGSKEPTCLGIDCIIASIPNN